MQAQLPGDPESPPQTQCAKHVQIQGGRAGASKGELSSVTGAALRKIRNWGEAQFKFKFKFGLR